MKKFVLLVLCLVFFLIGQAQAANEVWDVFPSKGYMTLTTVASGTTFTAVASPILTNVRISRIVVNCNTATPPTANTTQVVFTLANGIDIAYGQFLALTASEVRQSHTFNTINTVYDAMQITGTITPTITGNSVTSAIVTIEIYFEQLR